jgi:cobalt/nickel transport system ATP-binding protein
VLPANVPSQPLIAVSHLGFRYPDGSAALSHITFDLHPGESVGIVGPNGAGKTTLLLCLAGILQRAEGALTVAGLDPGNSQQRTGLPEHVGLVFQNSDDQLFCASVEDDVAFGPLNLGLPREEVQQRVTTALAQVGMAGMEDRVPGKLSGGEKRRVALAGVLAMHPKILLLDEPTQFLDPRGRRELATLLTSLAIAQLIASHDLDFVLQTCRRVVLIDAGKQVAVGTTPEVLGNAALMEQHGLEVPYRLRGRANPIHAESMGEI